MHIQPFYEKYDYIGNNESEYIFNNGLCLPSDTKLTDEQILRISDYIKGLWTDV